MATQQSTAHDPQTFSAKREQRKAVAFLVMALALAGMGAADVLADAGAQLLFFTNAVMFLSMSGKAAQNLRGQKLAPAASR